MKSLEDLKKTITRIVVGKGITHTGTVIDLLRSEAWSDGIILPVVFEMIAAGILDPNGCKEAFKEN